MVSGMCEVDGVSIRADEFDTQVGDILKAKAEKAGKISKAPCKKTMMKIRAANNIKVKAAEITTDARLVATSNICNFITFAAMNTALVVDMNIHTALIVNIDATQFKVESDSAGKVYGCVAMNDDGSMPNPDKPLKAAPREGDNSSGGSFFIKYYLLMTAAGNVMDLVFVIQDRFMEPETMDSYWVSGLGVGTDVTAGGWVIFCETRGCNTTFYRWLLMDYLPACLTPHKPGFSWTEIRCRSSCSRSRRWWTTFTGCAWSAASLQPPLRSAPRHANA
jgi:hypothetical protein